MMLHALLKENIIPILPPLGYDGRGDMLRLNSDEIAVDVAIESWIQSQEERAVVPLIETALDHVLPILTEATRRRPQ